MGTFNMFEPDKVNCIKGKVPDYFPWLEMTPVCGCFECVKEREMNIYKETKDFLVSWCSGCQLSVSADAKNYKTKGEFLKDVGELLGYDPVGMCWFCEACDDRCICV